ncbi:hypothetical protein EXIGLDRAFT_735787 [Exidia glandulosa HHB12029]|uniref:CBM1 domain-containing protein n=1 Tax=Exidia glandulosa HHB12029 TaxID=1314781 RepID=A0A165PKZ4_EXIGL|nr:hypothetical protein EXIGLDRAFT_735787 [Exidia glandulosa HHB12029]
MLFRCIIALTALAALVVAAPVPNACGRDVLGKRCCHCNDRSVPEPAGLELESQ